MHSFIMRSLDMYDEHVALDVCQESYFFLRLPEGVRPDLSLWLIFLYVNFFFFFSVVAASAAAARRLKK